MVTDSDTLYYLYTMEDTTFEKVKDQMSMEVEIIPMESGLLMVVLKKTIKQDLLQVLLSWALWEWGRAIHSENTRKPIYSPPSSQEVLSQQACQTLFFADNDTGRAEITAFLSKLQEKLPQSLHS